MTCMGGGRTGQPQRRLQRTALSAANECVLQGQLAAEGLGQTDQRVPTGSMTTAHRAAKLQFKGHDGLMEHYRVGEDEHGSAW